jgi:glutamate racemase
MMMNTKPLTIGVFDSGVGGLTVARELIHTMPYAKLIYLGDTAHVPYGPRPLEEVKGFALEIIEFLFSQNADAVIMGCNMSAASGAGDAAASLFPKPVLGVVLPGSMAASKITKNQRVGVIATMGTANSGIYQNTLEKLGEEAFVIGCPKFVPLVESGNFNGPEVDAAVVEYLTPLCDAGVDTLIFGCTHYPFLREAIAAFMGDSVELIDPAIFTVEKLQHMFNTESNVIVPLDEHLFYSSGDPQSLRREGEKLLGLPMVNVHHVDVPK